MSSPGRKEQKNQSTPQTKAEECMHALMTTFKIIHRYGESKLSEHSQFKKLSGPRIGVLFIVQASGSIKMGDLANKLMISPRTVTDLIDGMERDGFLKRVPHPSDRRAMFIELSPEIKDKFHIIADLRNQFSEEMFSVLSSKEQDELIRLLDKLREGPLAKLMQASEITQ